MLTFEKFTGINNVLPARRLAASDLAKAVNVDIGLTGEISRRAGFTEVSDACHKNLWQAGGFMLATVSSDLTAIHQDSARTAVLPELGPDRVWYCNLPDGRTTFSNGLINGITDGLTATGWGVPVPASIGELIAIAGELFPGDYQYQITYVRLSDGLEGGPAYSNPISVPDGGIFLSGLPVLASYRINVYLTGPNGDEAFFAGSTPNGVFSYIGKNDALTLPCRTGDLAPAPVGTVTAFWRGRALVAQGHVLWASRTNQVESFDMRRDFKQFSAPITLIQPVEGGIFIGTEKELAFLAGVEFDKLVYQQAVSGPVVLGSGVTAPGELVQRGEATGQGRAMICLADRCLVAGFSDGGISRMTEGRYVVDAGIAEVSASFRKVNGIPQYIAIPQ